MATTTTNLGLRKPAVTDAVNVTTDISNNMDLIDAAIGALLGRNAFRPTAVLAETVPRGYSNLASSSVLSDARVLMQAIWLPACTITSISFYSGTTALTRGSNADSHLWFAICDSTFTQLRATADDTSAAWAANSIHTLNLASQLTVTAGLYYMAIMVAAGTGGSPTDPAVLVNAGSTNLTAEAPRLCANFDGTQTTPHADGFTFTVNAGQAVNVYAQVR